MTVAIVLLAPLAVLIALYYAAPGVLFRAATVLGRRLAGLRLAHVEVDGHRVAYLDGGRGEPLLLLHGFGANKDHWITVARLLTPHFRVIALDLPGFGDSTRRLEARYGVDQQLARLAAFADYLGLGRFHIGGNSMGGYLATLFAARYPERVASLWLLAPAGALSAEPSVALNLMSNGDNPLIATDIASFDRLTALCFCKQPYLPAQFKRLLLARAKAEAAFNAKMFDDMFNAPLALETSVGDLAAPTLLVWGHDDRILHPSGQAVLRPLFRNDEVILMKDMGHVPMIERPAETAQDLLRFHRRESEPRHAATPSAGLAIDCATSRGSK